MSLDSEVALFFKGSMSIQDHRDSTSLKTWGSDAARIEEATALFVLYFTELQEAVVILSVLHSTQWTRYDHRFPVMSTSRSVQIFNHGLIWFAFCLSKYCHI